MFIPVPFFSCFGSLFFFFFQILFHFHDPLVLFFSAACISMAVISGGKNLPTATGRLECGAFTICWNRC